MNILIKLVLSFLRSANPNTPSSTAALIGLAIFASLAYSPLSYAEDYYWQVPGKGHLGRFGDAISAANADVSSRSDPRYSYSLGDTRWQGDARLQYCVIMRGKEGGVNNSCWSDVYRYGDGCTSPSVYNPSTRSCDKPPEPELCPGDSVRGPDGQCVLDCPLGSVPDPVTMKCKSICADGQFWDFETESCKWPQDENCPVGSNWNPASNDCVCDGGGVLSNMNGFRMCFPPADGECTKDSPDFVGYYNGLTPFCNGRARCPDGTSLGTVGSGDSIEHVCVPAPGKDPNCPDGQSGVKDGKKVCLPKPGKDPDCPSGQSGMVDGKKVCLPKPGDPGACKAGETPGFAGKGDDMQPTCVPEGYKPETCPAGSYSVNVASGGFACVTVSDGKKPGTDGGESGPGKGGSGDNVSSGTGTVKDKDGKEVGKFDLNVKMPEGLLLDQPTTDYYKETTEFGESELGKLDQAATDVITEFQGPDGAFTERVKLDQGKDYLLGLFGYSTNCSGKVTFVNWNGHVVSGGCDRLNDMKKIFGWLLSIVAAMSIWNTLTRKNED